jgi:ribosomal protein L3
LIRGSVPGPKGFDLLIEPSVKAREVESTSD